MSVSLIVTGIYGNGRKKIAGLHWPKTVWSSEFDSRVANYGKIFKQEIENAKTNEAGMPTYEEISVEYVDNDYYSRVAHVFKKDGVRKFKIHMALTNKAFNKLKEQMPVLEGELNNCNVRERIRRANINEVVIDLRSKVSAKHPETLWSKVRLYANVLFKEAFCGIKNA